MAGFACLALKCRQCSVVASGGAAAVSPLRLDPVGVHFDASRSRVRREFFNWFVEGCSQRVDLVRTSTAFNQNPRRRTTMSSPRRTRTRILATAATAAAGLALTAAAPAAVAQTAAPQEALLFANGAPITTVDGDLMHAHGGGVLKVGDAYYMVGEQRV
jgi:hypothetical protein